MGRPAIGVPAADAKVACVRDRWARATRRGVDVLFPPECAVCRCPIVSGQDVPLCDGCRDAVALDSGLRCGRCGALASASIPSGRCSRCRKARLHFDTVLPLGVYEDVLRSAVLRLKRPREEALNRALAELMCEKLGERLAGLRADVVTPVPMHWTRRLRRGVNAAELLAEHVGRRLGVPVARRLLVRRRNTIPQAELSPSQRLENVRDAFGIGGGYGIRAARVLLVDDILTTGATCSEGARILRRVGAGFVAAVVVARAEGLA